MLKWISEDNKVNDVKELIVELTKISIGGYDEENNRAFILESTSESSSTSTSESTSESSSESSSASISIPSPKEIESQFKKAAYYLDILTIKDLIASHNWLCSGLFIEATIYGLAMLKPFVNPLDAQKHLDIIKFLAQHLDRKPDAFKVYRQSILISAAENEHLELFKYWTDEFKSEVNEELNQDYFEIIFAKTNNEKAVECYTQFCIKHFGSNTLENFLILRQHEQINKNITTAYTTMRADRKPEDTKVSLNSTQKKKFTC